MADVSDALSGAQATINAQKAASLAAIAQGGQAAANAYQAAQSGNQAAKAAALKAQLGNLGNSPGQFDAGQQAILAAPYDNAGAALQTMGQARQDFMANLGASTGSYMDESSAAIPAMRNAAHLALLNANTKLSVAAQAQNQALQLAQLRLQTAEQTAASNNPATNQDAALKALGPTAADQGANLFGMGQNQSTLDAAQASNYIGANPTVAYDPTGATQRAITGSLPTIDPTAAQTPVKGILTSGNGQETATSTPVGVAGQGELTALQQAQTSQYLDQLIAQLGASGAPGYVPGEAPMASPYGSGGAVNIPPALATQVFNASSQGTADKAAVTAAGTAATAADKVAANPTTQDVRNSPAWNQAVGDYFHYKDDVASKQYHDTAGNVIAAPPGAPKTPTWDFFIRGLETKYQGQLVNLLLTQYGSLAGGPKGANAAPITPAAAAATQAAGG